MSATESNPTATQRVNGTTNNVPNGAANGIAPKVPEWLTADLFVDLLKEKVPDFRQIKNFKAKPALSAGENYATLILHIEIDAELQSGAVKSLAYMLKVPIVAMKEFMKKFNIFDMEMSMYRSVVTEMEQMYRAAGVEVKFNAQMYELNTPSEFGVVMLEDLRLRGFKNTNRLDCLDMEHTKCVLRKLAQWHAASAVRVETKGKYPSKLMEGFFTETHIELMAQMLNSKMKAFMKCVKFYEGHELYIDSLEKYQEVFVDELFRAAKFDPNEFNVLNHGDCWSNNIMFQYDAFGKIKETYFVDYQIPNYGTPAQDLLYFILSSTKYELKLKQFDYFIKLYHDNLIEHLTLLKYPKKMPTLKDIHISLYKYGVWGYSTTSGVMAAVLVDPNENSNLENIWSDTESGKDLKMLMFSNQRYRKHAEAILPWLYNRGAFEC